MKKSIILLLFVLYGFSSSGLSVYVHYCCGKIKKIDFIAGSHKGKCSSSCNMHAFSKTCCESKEFNNHIKDSYVPEAAINSLVKQFQYAAEVTPLVTDQFVFQSAPARLHACNSSPPVTKGESLNILYCIFRI